jgi:ribosomal protein S14
MTDKLGETSVAIREYPTRLSVRCVECGHQAEVSVFLDRGPPRLRCSVCGNPDPIINGKDYSRQWSRQRKGKNSAAHGGKRPFRGKSRK